MVDKIIKGVVIVLAVVAIILAVMIVFKDKNPETNQNQNSTALPSSETPTGEQTEEPNATPDATETPEVTPEPTATPTTLLSGLVICIDPGHQKTQMTDKEALAPWDSTLKTKCASGTQGKFTNVPEYEVALQISLKIRDILVLNGATVVMTRETNDVMLSNIDRANIGNECNADVVLRIHCNGFDNEAVNGIECLVPDKGDNSATYKELAAYDKKLATELLDYLVAATGANKRDVYTSDSYTGLNWSTVPSIIVEAGFMSNEVEDNLLISETYQKQFATGVLNWLVNSKVLKRDK